MLPDWCQNILKPFAGKAPAAGATAAHHAAGVHHPTIASIAHPSAHIGIGSGAHHTGQAGFTYLARTVSAHHAATAHFPLWAKKAAIIAAACATPPLVLTALARQPTANPGFTPQTSGPAGVQAAPEPSGLFVFPLGVGAVVILSRRKMSCAS